ncbi:TorD/DmsD family molecular chaperone [Natronobeatus ordinarius]|uniref:TorD/DmsD family molecular chaperone n=1 Tax=Natronobeatus ordinarius TaxID=2963433 RepID=UPI0020CE0622|nr:molecular chaperone TorD family protein [Natronobeatus ordinarius]
MHDSNRSGRPSAAASTIDDATPSELGPLLAPVYRTLGRAYLEAPDDELLESLESLCSAVATDPELPDNLATAVDAVLAAETDLEQLRAAFTRLFHGVSRGESTPPPYESLYVDGVLNGPSSPAVEAFYLEAGFELAVDDHLVDHAGYELAFLAELCAQGDRTRQLAFVETHVGDWLPEFHDAAERDDPPAFYRGLFALTEAVLDLHVTALEEEGVTIDR